MQFTKFFVISALALTVAAKPAILDTRATTPTESCTIRDDTRGTVSCCNGNPGSGGLIGSIGGIFQSLNCVLGGNFTVTLALS